MTYKMVIQLVDSGKLTMEGISEENMKSITEGVGGARFQTLHMPNGVKFVYATSKLVSISATPEQP